MRTPVNRTWLGVALAVVTVSLSVFSGGASAKILGPDFKLNPGQHRFWGPVNVDEAHVLQPDLCGTACFNYTIEATEPGRLRVALHAVFQNADDIHSWPDPQFVGSETVFDLQLLDAQGKPLDAATNPAATGSTGKQIGSVYAV